MNHQSGFELLQNAQVACRCAFLVWRWMSLKLQVTCREGITFCSTILPYILFSTKEGCNLFITNLPHCRAHAREQASRQERERATAIARIK
jgi:hypothetical protein